MWNSPPPKPSFGPLPQPPVWEPCSLTSVQPVPHPPHLAANFYHHWMVHRLSLLKNNNDKQNFPFSLFFPAVKATFPSTSAQAQFSGALPVSRCFPSSPQLYPAKPPCLPSSKWCAKVVNNPGSLFFFGHLPVFDLAGWFRTADQLLLLKMPFSHWFWFFSNCPGCFFSSSFPRGRSSGQLLKITVLQVCPALSFSLKTVSGRRAHAFLDIHRYLRISFQDWSHPFPANRFPLQYSLW